MPKKEERKNSGMRLRLFELFDCAKKKMVGTVAV